MCLKKHFSASAIINIEILDYLPKLLHKLQLAMAVLPGNSGSKSWQEKLLQALEIISHWLYTCI